MGHIERCLKFFFGSIVRSHDDRKIPFGNRGGDKFGLKDDAAAARREAVFNRQPQRFQRERARIAQRFFAFSISPSRVRGSLRSGRV